jgi:hypothetical protein
MLQRRHKPHHSRPASNDPASASPQKMTDWIGSRSQTALFGVSYLFNGTPVK